MHLFELLFSLDICPGVRLLSLLEDHMVALFLDFFLEHSILFFLVAAQVYVPDSVGGLFILHTFSNIYYL